MDLRSVNPANDNTMEVFEVWDEIHLFHVLQECDDARLDWQKTTIEERCGLMRKAGQILRENQEELARHITLEMGKLIGEARAEVEKCALGCEYYADHGPGFLQDEVIESDAGKSYVTCQPLGTVLAVMPWNFPFWQVFRFAAPALIAGNTAVLKHASNVPHCAKAIENIFIQAGFPENVFRTLMIPASMVARVIEDDRIHAVTLTGSEPAGRDVASRAGKALKKSVLELGGSDPFIVLPDADLDYTVEQAVISRFLNCGQSCIAAKRFIVVGPIVETFIEKFKLAVDALRPGDPLNENTTLAPMARRDLRDELQKQVNDSITSGAVVVTGCGHDTGSGAYLEPSILDQVRPGMRAYDEEMFGPVAIIIRAKDEEDAIKIANGSRYGLGGSVWTQDIDRGERIALRLQCGAAFVNGMVKSDPRLPFGGIKASGYGRELSRLGIHEFVNAKTIWIK